MKRGTPIRWTKTEETTLLEMTAEGASVSEIASKLGRTLDAITTRRKHLRPKGDPRYKHWTPDEERMFVTMFNSGATREVLGRTFQTTQPSIDNKIVALGLHMDRRNDQWTPERESALTELIRVKGESLERCSILLGVTTREVRYKCAQLGLPRPRRQKGREWTRKDALKVKAMFGAGDPVTKIAMQFESTISAVYAIIRKHGFSRMTKTSRPDRWLAEESDRLVALLDAGHSADEVIAILNKRPWGVICEVSRRGLSGKYRTIQDKRKQLKQGYWEDLEGCLRERLIRSRGRAKHSKKQYPFDLTYEDLLDQYTRQSGLCYYTGVKMTLIPNHPDVISVDRYDSTKGYTKDNIVLCRWYVNYVKQDLATDELEEICSQIVAIRPSAKRKRELQGDSPKVPAAA